VRRVLKLKLSDNAFSNTREIQGFSKEKILGLKKKLTDLKNGKGNDTEVEVYLKKEFRPEILEAYSDYLLEIRSFIEDYLLSNNKDQLFHLKSSVFEELKLLTTNLANLSSNSRNVKRFIKNSDSIDAYIDRIKLLQNDTSVLRTLLKPNISKIEQKYNDEVYLWIETNKVKNLRFRLDALPANLGAWQDIKEIYTFVDSLVEAKDKKKPKKETELYFHFDEIFQYFQSKQDNLLEIHSDLLYLLYKNKIIYEQDDPDEFINVIERKEIAKKLKGTIRPLIDSLIKDKLQTILDRLEDLDEQFSLGEHGHLDLDKLLEQKYKVFFPQVVDYYFRGLDQRFQLFIQELSETSEKDFLKIINSYYELIDELSFKIDEIDTWVMRFDGFLKPFDNIISSLKKTLGGINSEIIRRKSEYMNYLNSIRDEGLRVNIRTFVDAKIAEVNKIISDYEDRASILIREELPQLKDLRELLSEYKVRIAAIKQDVFAKLDTYRENDVDLYHVIKHWESNFTRKKQQLTFLLSVLLNKIFKSFKDLIDEESILFAEITEITNLAENFEGLPLNFALSAYLANRLNEGEIRERISEMEAKINQLTTSLGLYQLEKSKLEEILENKVKTREGVAMSKVQCTICHKNINFVKDKLITCPFCGSTYHYLCVAAWLDRYNSCPMCQNQFLDPNLGLFEDQ